MFTFFLFILRGGWYGWHITAAAKNNIFGAVCSLFRYAVLVGVDKLLAGVRNGGGVSNWAYLLHIGEELLFLALFARYLRTKSSCFYNAIKPFVCTIVAVESIGGLIFSAMRRAYPGVGQPAVS